MLVDKALDAGRSEEAAIIMREVQLRGDAYLTSKMPQPVTGTDKDVAVAPGKGFFGAAQSAHLQVKDNAVAATANLRSFI